MTKKRLLPAFLAALLLLSMLPLSAAAAVASDLPQNMADSPILRALQYTGYDVQAQKDNGTLYRSGSYGSRTPASIRSKISYGTSCSGKETVADSSTATGKAPNIAKFEQSGLCCASFVTYYLCNYLPNIERADTQFILDAINATGRKSQSVFTWQTALNNLVSAGELEKIGTSSSNVDRKKLTPGDVIIFGNDSIPASVKLTMPTDNMFSGFGTSWLLVIIIGFILGFQLIKLFFEVAERYVVVAVLTLLCPVGLAMGGSKSTKDICVNYMRTYASMIVMMIMNKGHMPGGVLPFCKKTIDLSLQTIHTLTSYSIRQKQYITKSRNYQCTISQNYSTKTTRIHIFTSFYIDQETPRIRSAEKGA